jgi:hypothetical protein
MEKEYDFMHNIEETDETDAHIAFPGSSEDEAMYKKRMKKEQQKTELRKKILKENENYNSQ